MPRIRNLKPELWQDEGLGTTPIGARLLFIGLITQADDHGRFRAAPALVRSTIYPYDDSLSNRRIKEWLDALAESQLVVLYTVEGEQFGWFPRWEKHQRISNAGTPLYPTPPDPESPSDSLTESRGEPPRTAAGSRIKDQGSRIKDQQRAPTRANRDEGFDEIWESWSSHPELINHRKPHSDMRKAARTALGDYELGEILTAISLYATVLASDAHFFTHRWTLAEFLGRGVGKFVPDSEPLVRYVAKETQNGNGNGRNDGGGRRDPAAVHRRQVEQCQREYELRAAELGADAAREDVLGMFSDAVVAEAVPA